MFKALLRAICLLMVAVITFTGAAQAADCSTYSSFRKLTDTDSDPEIFLASLPGDFKAGERIGLTYVLDAYPGGRTGVFTVLNSSGGTIGSLNTTLSYNTSQQSTAGVLLDADYTNLTLRVYVPNATNLNPDFRCAPVPAPSITTLAPATGPAAGGTDVVITGTSFINVSGVSFGDTAAASYNVDSATQITAVSPPGTGTASVKVTSTSGTSSGKNFVYIPLPVVTSLSPTGGPIAGGGDVVITGTHFTDATKVWFDTEEASFVVNSDTRITATIPASALPGDVQVTVVGPGGTSVTGAATTYSYLDAPTLTGLSPTRGGITGGRQVTITGTAFVAVGSVTFGGVDATSYVVDSATQITAVAPPHALGSVAVEVTNGSGETSEDGIQFEYVDVPTVADVSVTVIQNSSSNPVTLDLSGPEATGVDVASPPGHGTASADGMTITYTPTAGYVGSDSFTYVALNDDGTSVPATVSVTVIPPNGDLTITQASSGGDDTFGFTLQPSGTRVSVTTSGGVGSSSPMSLPFGTYTVLADEPNSNGFGLTSIVCDDPGAVIDLAGRSATITLEPAGAVHCTFTSYNALDETTALIDDFLALRGDLILSNLPDAQRRINRLNGVVSVPGNPVAALMGYLPQAASGALPTTTLGTSLGAIDAMTGRPTTNPFDIWAETTFGRIDRDQLSGAFGLFTLGADYVVNESLLVGGFVQADILPDLSVTGGGAVNGTGWIAGPYATLRLVDEIYLDVLAGAGRSSNEIAPNGTYRDQFEADRWLASVSLSGQWHLDDWTLAPKLRLSYFEESSEAYVDTLGVDIPSVTTGLGQVSVGSRLSHRFGLDDGVIIDAGLMAEALGDIAGPAGATGIDDWRGRLEGTIDIGLAGATALGLSAAYDGIGSDRGSTTSLSMRLTGQFQ